MNYNASTLPVNESKVDCVCLPFFDSQSLCKTGELIDTNFNQVISKSIKTLGIESEAGKSFILPLTDTNFSRILLLGFGNQKEISNDTLRKNAKALASQIKDTNIKHLSIALDKASLSKEQQILFTKSCINEIENTQYSFDQFKSKKSPESALTHVDFHCENEAQEDLQATCSLAEALSKGVNTAKDLGNLPGNICTPSYLADQAEALAKSSKNFKVSILEESDLEELNMGAFLSVSKGSSEPGKLIVLEYQGGTKNEAPHMLVGKGITFDSGGISLKPGAQMDEMKYDMCGAASVMGTMTAIAQLQPKLNIVSIIASAENMPAGNASKPGDIVTSASGQTIEILNTDAEGRLVLCDALTYAEKYKPASVVDIATLTGACIVALGHSTSAVMGNNDQVINELLEAGKETDDKAWQLPIWDDYQELIDSPFADMQNIGGKGAGSITAACFLSRFAKEFPWAHLDIAGTAWVSGGKNKGATGRPVPMLLQYLLNKAS
mgnify:CR=1 FL=1